MFSPQSAFAGYGAQPNNQQVMQSEIDVLRQENARLKAAMTASASSSSVANAGFQQPASSSSAASVGMTPVGYAVTVDSQGNVRPSPAQPSRRVNMAQSVSGAAFPALQEPQFGPPPKRSFGEMKIWVSFFMYSMPLSH